MSLHYKKIVFTRFWAEIRVAEMAKKRKTVLKNFRLTREACRWLERKSASTGRTQTKLLLEALENTYGLKGRSA